MAHRTERSSESDLFSLFFAQPQHADGAEAAIAEEEGGPPTKRARIVSLPKQDLQSFRVRSHGKLLPHTRVDPLVSEARDARRRTSPSREAFSRPNYALHIHETLCAAMLRSLIACHDDAGAALLLAPMLSQRPGFDASLHGATITVGQNFEGGPAFFLFYTCASPLERMRVFCPL